MKIYKLLCVVIPVGGVLACLYMWLLLMLWLMSKNERGRFFVALFIPIALVVYCGLIHPLFWGKKRES